MIFASTNMHDSIPTPTAALTTLQAFRDGITDSKYDNWALVIDGGSDGGASTYGFGFDVGNSAVAIPQGTFNEINSAANAIGSAYVQYDVPVLAQQNYATKGGTYKVTLGAVADVRRLTDILIAQLQAQLNPLLAPGSLPAASAPWSLSKRAWVAGGIIAGVAGVLLGVHLYREMSLKPR